MSIQSQIDRIKTAVESAYAKLKSKGATLPTVQTVENLAECADTIFPAFYSYVTANGSQYLIFEQVPFECNLVSVVARWGIGNLSNNEIYTVFYNGATSDSRYRKKSSSSGNTPYNVSNTVVVTNEPDSNGTYTVKIYCDGCVFSSIMQYVCFLAKKQG